MADDPASLSNTITPMKGGEALFRLRVCDWRVVYTETLVIVSVIRIGPRGDVYDWEADMIIAVQRFLTPEGTEMVVMPAKDDDRLADAPATLARIEAGEGI